MRHDLTTDALIQLLHRYHPSGFLVDDPEYSTSEEAQRLNKLLRETMNDMQAWNGFILHSADREADLSTILIRIFCFCLRIAARPSLRSAVPQVGSPDKHSSERRHHSRRLYSTSTATPGRQACCAAGPRALRLAAADCGEPPQGGCAGGACPSPAGSGC